MSVCVCVCEGLIFFLTPYDFSVSREDGGWMSLSPYQDVVKVIR